MYHIRQSHTTENDFCKIHVSAGGSCSLTMSKSSSGMAMEGIHVDFIYLFMNHHLDLHVQTQEYVCVFLSNS